jgi:hypothetical protein
MKRRRRYTTDERLRAHGFQIFARPENAEAVWSRDGRRYSQTAALAVVAYEIKRTVEALKNDKTINP